MLGGPADLVIDPVFGGPSEAAVSVLGNGGRLVNLGGSAGDTATFSSAALRSKTLDILGYTNNALSPQQRADALRSVLTLAADGAVHIDYEEIDLADCARGWQEAAGLSGRRLVFTPGG